MALESTSEVSNEPSGIDASYKDELLTNSGSLNTKYASKINLLSSAYLNTEYLGFLMNENTLPIEIRKAINYGFDRANMIKYLRNNMLLDTYYRLIPYYINDFSILTLR